MTGNSALSAGVRNLHSNCIIDFLQAATLGGAYEGGGASPVGLQPGDLLQWAVGLQQRRRRRLLLLKAEAAGRRMMFPVKHNICNGRFSCILRNNAIQNRYLQHIRPHDDIKYVQFKLKWCLSLIHI